MRSAKKYKYVSAMLLKKLVLWKSKMNTLLLCLTSVSDTVGADAYASYSGLGHLEKKTASKLLSSLLAKNWYTRSRASSVLRPFNNLSVQVHSGNKYIPIEITDSLFTQKKFRYKFGDYAVTRINTNRLRNLKKNRKT